MPLGTSSTCFGDLKGLLSSSHEIKFESAFQKPLANHETTISLVRELLFFLGGGCLRTMARTKTF